MTFSLDELNDTTGRIVGQRFIFRFGHWYLVFRINWISKTQDDAYTAVLLGWFNNINNGNYLPANVKGMLVAAMGKVIAYTENRHGSDHTEFNNNDGLFGDIIMIPDHIIDEDSLDLCK
jgi:hypothetical protein